MANTKQTMTAWPGVGAVALCALGAAHCEPKAPTADTNEELFFAKCPALTNSTEADVAKWAKFFESSVSVVSQFRKVQRIARDYSEAAASIDAQMNAQCQVLLDRLVGRAESTSPVKIPSAISCEVAERRIAAELARLAPQRPVVVAKAASCPLSSWAMQACMRNCIEDPSHNFVFNCDGKVPSESECSSNCSAKDAEMLCDGRVTSKGDRQCLLSCEMRMYATMRCDIPESSIVFKQEPGGAAAGVLRMGPELGPLLAYVRTLQPRLLAHSKEFDEMLKQVGNFAKVAMSLGGRERVRRCLEGDFIQTARSAERLTKVLQSASSIAISLGYSPDGSGSGRE